MHYFLYYSLFITLTIITDYFGGTLIADVPQNVPQIYKLSPFHTILTKQKLR